MTEATGIYTAQRAKNVMTEADTDAVYRLWEGYESVIDRCAVVDLGTIAAKDYTLSVNQYIEKTPAPPIDPAKVRREFLQALEDVKTAEARLRELLQEGGWLDE